MKILIAVDGSDYTKRMLEYLAAHRELLGPGHEYTVVHSVLAVPPHAASYVSPETLQRFYEDEAETVLGPVRSSLQQQGIEARFVHTRGRAAESIARVAREGGFDLLVLGSHGQGGLLKLVLGSVATEVLAACKTPVLLVR